MKNIFESAREVLEAANKNVTVVVEFPVNIVKSISADRAFNAERIIAQRLLKQAGFKYISDEEDPYQEILYIKFSGEKQKVAAWIRRWMRETGNDDEIIKDYSESVNESSANGYSGVAPVAKVRILSAVIKSIPDKKVPYIIDVIAAGASHQQIKEIIAFMKKP